MFRRRRREDADRPEPDFDEPPDDPEWYSRLSGREDREGRGLEAEASGSYAEVQGTGPWDGAGPYPRRDRIDLGSLLIPAREDIEVEVEMAETTGVWVTVLRGESALQLMAFAAPKTSGLWDDVRLEFADEVAKSGGDSQEVQGPFGIELLARVHPVGEGGGGPLEPVRFMGVDGPRWFLRGMIRGPAARRADLARPFEELFADIVVVRGDHPAPPGELLEIRLPEDTRQALEEQLGQAGLADPFERGPETTETR